ncbi:hypothetical protein D3C85_1710980 [compost metagenome]
MRQRLQRGPGSVERVEALEEFRWHVVDHRRRVRAAGFVDHGHFHRPVQRGDHEDRLRAAIEQVLVGFHRLHAGHGLGAELARLAGQDHEHEVWAGVLA